MAVARFPARIGAVCGRGPGEPAVRTGWRNRRNQPAQRAEPAGGTRGMGHVNHALTRNPPCHASFPERLFRWRSPRS